MKRSIIIYLIHIFIISTCFAQKQGVIVYASEKTGYFEIYTHSLGSNTTKQLTRRNSDMPDYAPSFSADGKSITFISYRKRGWRSWIMDANGENKRLANKYNTYNAWARISPDNTKMVFQSYRPSHNLYLADAEGSNPKLLLKSKLASYKYRATPNWSPDGKFITFCADKNGVLTIFKANLENNEVINLSYSKENSMSPSFSPDGNKILYTSLVNGLPQIFIVDSNGGNIKQLTQNNINDNFYAKQNMNDFVASRLAITAAWSPDGNWIVYSKIVSKNIVELFIMDKKGNNRKQLTFDKSIATSPSWSLN